MSEYLPIFLTAIVVATTIGGGVTMAQTTGDLEKQIEQLKKEKDKLDAEKAKLESEKALAEAQAQAAIASFIGDVKAGPYSGAVEVKDKPGTEEAALLSARAVKEGANKITTAVQGQGEVFYVFGSKEFPKFQQLLLFRFRNELIKQAFQTVREERIGVAAVTPGMVSAGLEAFPNLLGFFKTDYTIGGVETKLDESLLLFEVAGQLSNQPFKKHVHLPLIYQPTVQTSAVAALQKELSELVGMRTQAAEKARKLKDEIASLEKQAAETQDPQKKAKLLAEAADRKAKLEPLNAVIALYDTFATSLTSPDANTGAAPLPALAQEVAIDEALKAPNACVLLLRLESTGGGYLVKKNLLTGLWKMPLYHMGGATVSNLILRGSDGGVLGAGVIPIYGGFVRTDKLRKELSQ